MAYWARDVAGILWRAPRRTATRAGPRLAHAECPWLEGAVWLGLGRCRCDVRSEGGQLSEAECSPCVTKMRAIGG